MTWAIPPNHFPVVRRGRCAFSGFSPPRRWRCVHRRPSASWNGPPKYLVVGQSSSHRVRFAAREKRFFLGVGRRTRISPLAPRCDYDLSTWPQLHLLPLDASITRQYLRRIKWAIMKTPSVHRASRRLLSAAHVWVFVGILLYMVFYSRTPLFPLPAAGFDAEISPRTSRPRSIFETAASKIPNTTTKSPRAKFRKPPLTEFEY